MARLHFPRMWVSITAPDRVLIWPGDGWGGFSKYIKRAMNPCLGGKRERERETILKIMNYHGDKWGQAFSIHSSYETDFNVLIILLGTFSGKASPVSGRARALSPCFPRNPKVQHLLRSRSYNEFPLVPMTLQLCDLGQVTKLLCASVFSFCKMGTIRAPTTESTIKVQWGNITQQHPARRPVRTCWLSLLFASFVWLVSGTEKHFPRLPCCGVE